MNVCGGGGRRSARMWSEVRRLLTPVGRQVVEVDAVCLNAATVELRLKKETKGNVDVCVPMAAF